MRSRTIRWLVTGALAASMLVLGAPSATAHNGPHFHPPAVSGNYGSGAGDGIGWFGCQGSVQQAGYWELSDGSFTGFYYGGDPADQPVTGDWNSNNLDTVGVYRNGTWLLNYANDSSAPDLVFSYGNPGDKATVGDWDGDGDDTVGVYRNGWFYLRNYNSTGIANIAFAFGNPGDVPLAGDWDGDGDDTIGVYRPSTGYIYLRNSNSTGPADIVTSWPTYHSPYAGDLDGDGDDEAQVSGRVC